MNLTVNQDLLSVGTLALQLGKSDVGSGVASVDIYELIGNVVTETITSFTIVTS